MSTEIDDVMDKLQPGPSQIAHPDMETTDTSGDESDLSPGKKKILSKRTYRMKKAWASSEFAGLFVTGRTDPVGKPSPFYCQLCRRDVLLLTHGSLEILRYYQSTQHFAMDQ